MVLPQDIYRALQLIFRLLQAGRIDPKLVQENFDHLAIGSDREFGMLGVGLQDLRAKLHALVADEDARTRD